MHLVEEMTTTGAEWREWMGSVAAAAEAGSAAVMEADPTTTTGKSHGLLSIVYMHLVDALTPTEAERKASVD